MSSYHVDEQLSLRLDEAFLHGPPVPIPYSLIQTWTGDFAEENIVGRGGFGSVYRGRISSISRLVAVKKISGDLVSRICTTSSVSEEEDNRTLKDVLKTVEREINVLSVFRNCQNIIRLIGYSSLSTGKEILEKRHRLGELCLVYEFADRGDLLHMLKSNAVELVWQLRLRIAWGIAKGLNCLHLSDPGHPAFHRDVKSSNVVITSDLTPKLIDCGLSKYIPEVSAVGYNMSVFTTSGMKFGMKQLMY